MIYDRNTQSHQDHTADQTQGYAFTQKDVAEDNTDNRRGKMKYPHVAGDIALVEFGRYDKTDTGDDHPLIENTGCNFNVPLAIEIALENQTEEKKHRDAQCRLPEQQPAGMDALGQPFDIDQPQSQKKCTSQHQEISEEILKFLKYETLCEYKYHTQKRERHPQNFERLHSIAGKQEVRKYSDEKRMGGNQNGGAPGQGMMNTDIHKTDLDREKNCQQNQAAFFAGLHFQGNPFHIDPDQNNERAYNETDARQRKGGDSG